MATREELSRKYVRTILTGMDMYSENTVLMISRSVKNSPKRLQEVSTLIEQRLPEEDFIKELKKIREEQVQ